MVDVSEKETCAILEKANCFGSYKGHEVLRLSDKPIGYLADHYILRVHLTSPHRSKDFFLKAVPRSVEKRVEYLDETGFFSKEVALYQKLIPVLLEQSSISWAPEFYLAKDDHFITMEILNEFRVKSTKDLVFDLDHLKIASATLAVFHAATIIYENKSGQEISSEFMKMLEENAYPKVKGVRQQGLENAIEVFLELIKMIPKYQDSPMLSKILRRFPDTIRTIYKYAETSKKYKNVVSHGDLWANNFMFKYENEKPIECKFIDFQLARYSPPAFDLAQLVYINSTKRIQDSHLDDILNIYCDSFETELRKAAVDVAVLPRTEIVESFKKYHLAGLIEGVVFGHLILLPPTMSSNILSSNEEYEKFINKSRVEVCMHAFKEDYYRDRLTELITEIIEHFVITKDDK